jgi:hypothetical protein
MTLAKVNIALTVLKFERRKLNAKLKINRRKENELKADYLISKGWMPVKHNLLIEPGKSGKTQWSLTHAFNIQKQIEEGTWPRENEL